MKNCNCVNFGNCSRADTAQVVEVDPSVLEPLCEECGRPLNETAGRSGGGRGGGRAVMAIVMLVLAIGMLYGAFRILIPTVRITSQLAAKSVVGEPFAYQIVATGKPNKFAATGLPAGLKLTPDGKIVGSAEQDGKSVVEIVAISPKGSDKKKLEITIAIRVVDKEKPPIPTPVPVPGHEFKPEPVEVATNAPPLVENTSLKLDLDENLRFQIQATGQPDHYWAGKNAPAGITVDQASGSLTGKFTKAGIYAFSVYAAHGSNQGQGQISVEVTDRKASIRSALLAASGHLSDLAALETESDKLNNRKSVNGDDLRRILNDRISSLRERLSTDLAPLRDSLESAKAPAIEQVVASLIRDSAEFKGKEAHRRGMTFLARNWRKLSETTATSGVLFDMRTDLMKTVLQRS